MFEHSLKNGQVERQGFPLAVPVVMTQFFPAIACANISAWCIQLLITRLEQAIAQVVAAEVRDGRIAGAAFRDAPPGNDAIAYLSSISGILLDNGVLTS